MHEVVALNDMSSILRKVYHVFISFFTNKIIMIIIVLHRN